MSNQEAIALLRNLEDSLNSYCELSEEGKTAFRMAIEALSSSEFPNSSDTDTISRQAAIEAMGKATWAKERLAELPPVEPEIIYCKDCRKHNKLLGDYEIHKDGSGGHWIFKTEACPLAEFRGKAQGHEFDYQFCAFGKRRTE